MASITPLTLLSSPDAQGTGSYTTSSFTTTSSSLLLVCVSAMGTNVPPGDVAASITCTISSGETGTARLTTPQATNWICGQRWFTFPITTGGSGRTLTVDAGSFDVYKYRVKAYTITGHNAASPVGATANPSSIPSGSGAQTIALNATPASDSYVFAAATISMNGATGAVNPGSGWTEDDDVTLNDWETFEIQHITGLTSTSVPWASVDANSPTGTNFDVVLAAIEIKNASGGGSAVTGTGALAAGAAALAGTGSAVQSVTGSGALVAAVAVLAGTGTRNGGPVAITGNGTLLSADSTLSGAGLHSAYDTGSTVELVSSSASLAGIGYINARVITGTGSLLAAIASMSGAGTMTPQGSTVTGTGALVAGIATLAGSGLHGITGSGSPAAAVAVLVGAGSTGLHAAITGTGALIADIAALDGLGARGANGNGALYSDVAILTARAPSPWVIITTPDTLWELR